MDSWPSPFPMIWYNITRIKPIYASYHKVKTLELQLLYDDGYYTNLFDNSILVCTNGLHQVCKSSISTYQDNNPQACTATSAQSFVSERLVEGITSIGVPPIYQ